MVVVVVVVVVLALLALHPTLGDRKQRAVRANQINSHLMGQQDVEAGDQATTNVRTAGPPAGRYLPTPQTLPFNMARVSPFEPKLPARRKKTRSCPLHFGVWGAVV